MQSKGNELRSSEKVRRYENNPVLAPQQVPYPCELVFNAGVIKHQGQYVMVFRNDYGYKHGMSFAGTNTGLALSPDGIRWEVRKEPFLLMEGEEIQRAYDPRLAVIDGQAYCTFAVDTKHGLLGGIAKTEDFIHYEPISLSAPDNRNMVLFPEKIGGMYMRLERPMPVYSRGGKDRFDIWISQSPDLVYWGKPQLLSGVEDYPFANNKIGPGAPPIRTDRGWLALTHAVDLDTSRGKNGWEDKWQKRYCAGAMLLDLNDPYKVLGIYKKPLLAPETPYETTEGFRTHVIFPTGLVAEEDGTCKIYYGASDTVVALATAKIDDLVDLCLQGE